MIIPNRLQSGDAVVLVAPSGVLQTTLSLRFFQQHEWHVEIGKNVYQQHYRLAGTDAARLQDLQQALDNTTAKAIFCARGGYGITRILDRLDFSIFLKYPKWVIGYSDITALLLRVENLGIASIHGAMVTEFDQKTQADSVKALFETLSGQVTGFQLMRHACNRVGTAQAPLTGGNLTMICNSMGTRSEIQTTGKILFVEEVGEQLYHIDRMWQQLKRSGKLEHLAGLVIGHFTRIQDTPTLLGKPVQSIIREVVEEYNYPVAFHIPAGHEAPNMPLVIGETYQLVVKESYTILEPLIDMPVPSCLP